MARTVPERGDHFRRLADQHSSKDRQWLSDPGRPKKRANPRTGIVKSLTKRPYRRPCFIIFSDSHGDKKISRQCGKQDRQSRSHWEVPSGREAPSTSVKSSDPRKVSTRVRLDPLNFKMTSDKKTFVPRRSPADSGPAGILAGITGGRFHPVNRDIVPEPSRPQRSTSPLPRNYFLRRIPTRCRFPFLEAVLSGGLLSSTVFPSEFFRPMANVLPCRVAPRKAFSPGLYPSLQPIASAKLANRHRNTKARSASVQFGKPTITTQIKRHARFIIHGSVISASPPSVNNITGSCHSSRILSFSLNESPIAGTISAGIKLNEL